jgi:hypothetical protein
MASSGMRIGTEPIDMKTRFLARIAAFVTAAAAMAMFLAPATSSELNATPQRDGVYPAAIDEDSHRRGGWHDRRPVHGRETIKACAGSCKGHTGHVSTTSRSYAPATTTCSTPPAGTPNSSPTTPSS